MADLSTLPDNILLHILKHLSAGDLINIGATCRRLSDLSSDRAVVRTLTVEGEYFVSGEALQDLIHRAAPYVRTLNLNHCYWFSQRCINWVVSACKNISCLQVIECKLKIDALVKLVAKCTNLQQLALSISTFANIKKDVFTPAKKTMAGLKILEVYYTSREMALVNYFGEHATVLDYCDSLEELYIGSAGMAIPELYRPIISQPRKKRTLKTMCITSNIHAGAQMMFYGTLSQLPNSDIAWKTLLMPNVNLQEFVTKQEFKGCLSNMDTIENLDISGSKVMFPCEGLDITMASQLSHLNISMTLVNCDQLKIVADSCNKLTSVNLFGCGHIFQGRDGLDFSGLQALFEGCPGITQLNLAGAHHHLFMLPERDLGVIRHVFTKMKGLRSLALPMCMLADAGQSQSRSGKRLASSSPKSHSQHNKRRCVDTTASQSGESSSPDAGPSSGYPPTRSGHSASCGHTWSPPTRSAHLAANTGVTLVLEELLQRNPDIEELELLAVNFTSAIHKNKYVNPKAQQFGPCIETRRVRDAALEPVSRLRCLRRLVIVGAPGLLSGQCLVSISKQCSRLQTLHLGYLGGVMYSHIFAQALGHLQLLTDLRLEQPHISLNALLYDGLRRCVRLQRLCVIAKHSAFNVTDVLKLAEQLPRLVVLQLFAGGTITACKTLASTLHRRLSRQRPALSTSIYPLVYDGITEVTKAIPAKHLDELTRFQSRVAFLPAPEGGINGPGS